MSKKLLLIVSLIFFPVLGFAQENNSASEEFEIFERGGFQQSKPKPPPTKTPVGRTVIQRPTEQPATTPPKSVGKAGMKIWVEKQVNCSGQFRLVAPSTIFRSADCIRMRYRLNFEGYLTILNIGTTGKTNVIFPLNGQSNLIQPKTDHYLPDNRGWEFDENPGKEQIVFIVSRNPVERKIVDDYITNREMAVTNSSDMEVIDRDIKPRTENKQVYILSDETRIEKPIVFRMTIRHAK